MPEFCAEQLRLGKNVVESTAKMYNAKRDYDAAKNDRTKSGAEMLKLAEWLRLARDEARMAQRDFDVHVRDHQCRI
jgi:hypothetical protein